MKFNYSDIAKLARLTPAAVSLIMRRKRNPSLAVAKRMADALEVSLDDFYEYLASILPFEDESGN